MQLLKRILHIEGRIFFLQVRDIKTVAVKMDHSPEGPQKLREHKQEAGFLFRLFAHPLPQDPAVPASESDSDQIQPGGRGAKTRCLYIKKNALPDIRFREGCEGYIRNCIFSADHR